jgi:hypothetical protein
MSSNIAVITQDEFEETVLPNPSLTMAHPHEGPMMVAKIPEKKLIQKGLWGRVAKKKPKTTTTIDVEAHTRGSHQVEAHKRKVTTNSNGNKKNSKSIKAKKGKGTTKHSVFPKVQNDCRESVQLARSLHIQELRDLVNRFKK